MGHDKRQEPPSAPIFIVGPARSGTTLLRWALDTHPRIVSRSEQNFLRSIVLALKLEFLEEPIGDVFDEAKLKRLKDEQDLRLLPPEIARRYRDLHEGFFRALCEQAGKPRWADGTHSILDRMAPTIDLMYGQTPQYIIVTRHGLDCAASAAERFGGTLSHALQYWCATAELQAAFFDVHSSRCLRIKYEELVASPQSTMDSVFAFLGEERIASISKQMFGQDHGPHFGDHKIVHSAGSIHSRSVNRWRALAGNLVDEALQDCPRFEEVMTRIGYETPT